MNALKKKLKSSLGASSIIALLFFVVAMMVGAAVLSAAGTNAGRASHALKDQQEYYAVESAVRVLNSDLNDSVIVIEAEKDADPAINTELSTANLLKKFFSEEGQLVPATKELTIPENSEKAIPAVTGSVILSKADSSAGDGTTGAGTGSGLSEEDTISEYESYSLTITLWATDKDKEKKSNPVTLKYAPLVKTSKKFIRDAESDNDISGYVQTTEIRWYQESIERGVVNNNETPDPSDGT
ncbi:MAG: hypothetical protein Q4F31_05290 [Eubacteriales bacterium]|nr:hypothetical protein [Eubacteriales bacterium]